MSHALDQGWPPSVVDGLLNAYAAMVTEPAPVTTTVEEITGTPARTFREWAIDHADDFRGGHPLTATISDEWASFPKSPA